MSINQMKYGVTLSYISIVLTSVIGILLTPYMIKKMGTSEYGLYTLIGSLVGYLTLLDFGLNNTIIRFTAKYRAENNKDDEAIFFGTSFVIYTIISFIIVLSGVILYLNLDNMFDKSLSINELMKAKKMTLILILNIAITLPGGVFFGISSGYEHFVFPRLSRIIKYLIRSVLLIALLFYGHDAVSIVILDTVMNILLILSNAYYVFRIIKIQINFKKINKGLLVEIFNYSFWIFLIALTQLFQWKSGQLVLGVTTNTTNVAVYGVGIMLGGFYGAFGSAIASVFLPKATHMVVLNNSPKELTDMMIRVGRVTLIIILYILGAFILYGKEFIILWLGHDYIDAWLVSLLIMLTTTLIFGQSFGSSILEAKKLNKFKALFFLLSLIIGTLIGAMLSVNLSIKGMIIGITIAMIINQTAINIYYKRKLSLEITRFFKETFLGFMFPFILSLTSGYFINYFVDSSWLGFFIKSMIYTIFYVLFIYYLGMKSYEKQLFASYVENSYNVVMKNNEK